VTGVRLGIIVAAAIVLGAAVPAHADDEAWGDVCFEVASDVVTAEAWASVTDLMAETIAESTALFPDPVITVVSEALPGAAGPPLRLHVDAGHAMASADEPTATCLEPGLGWSARMGRGFLGAGADRMLAEAPTTPGIDSSVTLEWHPDEDRILTRLVFAGPLDIPNGTCWIDDALSIDEAGGTAVASGEQGLKTSLFAEGACGRFFDHLPDGGAGEQALNLLPTQVELGDGRVLRFVAEQVTVVPDAVIVGGRVEEG
jgi:hypothetical protein